MTIQEAYFDFQLLLNKNSELSNIKVPGSKYVFLFNREALINVRDLIRTSTIAVHDIQELYVKDFELDTILNEKNSVSYHLPNDFYDFIDSFSLTSQNNCNSKTINYLYKPKDSKLKISEDSYISFDHEESLCDLSEDKLIVYKKDYEINKSYLSYYKTIPEVDIEGYIKINGSFSENKHPQISDYLVHKINNLVVLEVSREFEDVNKVNISKDRIINK